MADDRRLGGGNAQPARRPKGLKASEARGLVAKRAWVRDRLLVSRVELAQCWDVPLEDIAAMAARGELYELEVSGRLWVPAVYLELPRDVVAEVNRALPGVDAATAFVFWHRKHGALGGRTVAEVLRQDTAKGCITELAQAYGLQMPAASKLTSVVDQHLLLQLGRRLKHIRLEYGMTTVELAKRAGLSRMTLRAIEAGERSPTIGSYVRVMNILGVSQDLALLASDVPEVPNKDATAVSDARHGLQDLQSLVLHQEAVKLLKQEPELIQKALKTLDQWRARGSSRSHGLWDEWAVILRKRDWRRALAHTSRSQQLRQASPLLTLLRDEVRLGILREVRRLRKEAALSSPVVPVLSPPSGNSQ